MFSDCAGNAISFYKKSNEKNISQYSQTEIIPKKMYKDEQVEVVEKSESHSQTDLKEIITKQTIKYDEKKLLKFLQIALDNINEALISRDDDNFEIYEEIDNEEYTTSVLMRLPLIDHKSQFNTKVSDMCWNSSGNILAISYYVDNHYGLCSHLGSINLYKFGNFSEQKCFREKIQIETNSCIKCMDSHPKFSNLFLAGSYTGEIYLINLSLENENNDFIQYISRIDSYFHKDCVVSVKWTKTENDGKYYFFSLSEEGRLLLWDPDDKFAFPILGFSLKFKILKNIYPINPTIITENPHDQFNFIIGTVDGNIYKCAFNKPVDTNFDYLLKNSVGVVWRSAVKKLLSNMSDKDVIEMKNYIEMLCRDKNIIDLNPDEFFKLKPDINKLYKNALKSNYEKHISVVTSVEFNPFVKNLFLTCSYDGSIRIYHQNYHGSKYLLSNNLNNEYYTSAIWSPYRANLVITGTSSGKISFHKIVEKSLRSIHSIERKIGNSVMAYPVNKIKCNNSINNIMAVSYDDGILDIIKLSDDLCEDKFENISKLNKIVNRFIN